MLFDIKYVDYTEFEVLCAIGNRGIKDFTRKGKCSSCGACCSNTLPLSRSEIERIELYVKEHNINASTSRDDFCSCPFLSNGNSCLVYEVRPLICKLFKCSRPVPPYKHLSLLLKEDREILDVRKTFCQLFQLGGNHD